MGKILGLKKNTEIGQLFSILDSSPQHKLGDTWEDDDGALYEYWKNTTAAACVVGNAHFKGFGNIGGDAALCGEQAVLVTAATVQQGTIGLAQGAFPDDYCGWFLVKGPTTNSQGRLYFGNAVNHTQTRTTTIGEPLTIAAGLFTDATTWALGGADALRVQFACALEAGTTLTNRHVYLTGDFCLTTI